MKNIPLIIPVFNQLTYLINIINWWRWYHPDNPVIILDNGSTYKPLLDSYKGWQSDKNIKIIMCSNNTMAENMKRFLIDVKNMPEIGPLDYYVISDPDIMPHPATPPNFLAIFKHCLDEYSYHHAGFGLITADLPDFMENRNNLLHDENMLLANPRIIIYEGKKYSGFKAPLDTTFALYKTANGGWHAPQKSESWDNSLRLFQAFHLGWYLHPNMLNPEMENYFSTARYRDLSPVSAGKNNYRPARFQK